MELGNQPHILTPKIVRDWWDGLPAEMQQRYDEHAEFLFRHGYLDVDRRTIAMRIAWSQRAVDRHRIGCPQWPGCGCGTQSGPHTCEWQDKYR